MIFLHGWFWWPITVGRVHGSGSRIRGEWWTAKYVRYSHAMSARTL